MKHTHNFQFLIFNFQFIIALSAMIMTSCVNDTPYDAELGAPKLVLNAILQPDSLLSATVSRTAHFLDTEEPPRLPDAIVTASIDGQSITLQYDEATQTYTSGYILCAGDEVTLTATHPIGTATATGRVMHPTPTAIAHTTMLPFTAPGDPLSTALLNKTDSALLVSIHLDDPVRETNYYRLSIAYEGSYEVMYPEDNYREEYLAPSPTRGTIESTETFYPHYLLTESSTRLFTTSESIAQMLGGLLYMTSTNSFIFTDENLRNKEGLPVMEFLFLMESPSTPLDLNPESGWAGDDMWENEDYIFPADTVSRATFRYDFTIEHLSADYYRYLEDVSTFEMTGGALIGEPTPIHTNIQGGLGIVGSYAITTCRGDTLYRFVP